MSDRTIENTSNSLKPPTCAKMSDEAFTKGRLEFDGGAKRLQAAPKLLWRFWPISRSPFSVHLNRTKRGARFSALKVGKAIMELALAAGLSQKENISGEKSPKTIKTSRAVDRDCGTDRGS
jgi:hypothetical protein